MSDIYITCRFKEKLTRRNGYTKRGNAALRETNDAMKFLLQCYEVKITGTLDRARTTDWKKLDSGLMAK